MKQLVFLGTRAPKGGEPLRFGLRAGGKVTELHFHRSGYYLARVPDAVADAAVKSAPSSFAIKTKGMERSRALRPVGVLSAFVNGIIHNAPEEAALYLKGLLRNGGAMTAPQKVLIVTALNNATALVEAGDIGKKGRSQAQREQEEETEAKADEAEIAARVERARAALLEGADATDDEQWTPNGKFRLNAVKELAGDRKISQNDLDAAWPTLTRAGLPLFHGGDDRYGPEAEAAPDPSLIAGANGVDDGKTMRTTPTGSARKGNCRSWPRWRKKSSGCRMCCWRKPSRPPKTNGRKAGSFRFCGWNGGCRTGAYPRSIWRRRGRVFRRRRWRSFARATTARVRPFWSNLRWRTESQD